MEGSTLRQPWKLWFQLEKPECGKSKWPIMLAGNGHGNGQGSLPQAPRQVDFSTEKPRPKAGVYLLEGEDSSCTSPASL